MTAAMLLMLLQAASYGPELTPAPAEAGAPECRAADPDAITVCGRTPRPERYRLKEALPDAPTLVPKAAWALSDKAEAGVAGEQATVGGWPSNRIMARLKLGF